MFKRSGAANGLYATKPTKPLFKQSVAAGCELVLRYLFKHLNMAAWMFGNFPHRRG